MSEGRIIKKSPEMDEYENETGKLAIWKGRESKEFRKWQLKKQHNALKKQGHVNEAKKHSIYDVRR